MAGAAGRRFTGGEPIVTDIAAVLTAPVSTVSGYLLERRQAGLVVERRRGRWIFYRLAEDDTVAALLGTLLASIDGDPDVQQDTAVAAGLRLASPSDLCEPSSANATQVSS
jgi:ArsR family transcriptional regulator